MSSPLKAIICGYEKSGTTLLNEILRRHPDMDSGFECGFLLGDSPQDFPGIQPYYGNFRKTWQLTRQDMHYICNTDDWQECYARARERCPFIADKTTGLFDKTPIYMLHLNAVLNKMPQLPCVVNVRDPRALFLSWARWSWQENPEQWINDNFEVNCRRFISYAEGYRQALASHGDRIIVNQFEVFCLNAEKQLEKIFNHLGLLFDPDYLYFSSRHFVYGNTISDEYVFPYREAFSNELCERILTATEKYSEWHYHA
ncbi:hypothetical protein CWI75_14320 [Kineobactrum sediminis]|uniref:Sulfotransferase n=1 Tax=Kineobactrum sediminis TaxID=1905677 RepID=A0A2N5XZS3_9GAMM|nr:sulfotransferase [Kineobactrum sediminis]PLW81641.1 hypothetical protein CWI75_14320 [Kineobactrum sediminis]